MSAESSITIRLYLSAIFLISGQSQRLPIRFGAKIATVFLFIAFSIISTSIQYVKGSTSTKTGTKLFLIKQPTDVPNVSAGVITSPSTGKLNDSMPINNAEEPELTYKHSFLLNNFAISFSNFLE